MSAGTFSIRRSPQRAGLGLGAGRGPESGLLVVSVLTEKNQPLPSPLPFLCPPSFPVPVSPLHIHT